MNDKLLMLLESVLGKSKSTAKQNYAFHCPYCQSARKKFEVSIINQKVPSLLDHVIESHKKLTTLFKSIKRKP
jgi:glutaredoxin